MERGAFAVPLEHIKNATCNGRLSFRRLSPRGGVKASPDGNYRRTRHDVPMVPIVPLDWVASYSQRQGAPGARAGSTRPRSQLDVFRITVTYFVSRTIPKSLGGLIHFSQRILAIRLSLSSEDVVVRPGEGGPQCGEPFAFPRNTLHPILMEFEGIQQNSCSVCGESGYESSQLWNRPRSDHSEFRRVLHIPIRPPELGQLTLKTLRLKKGALDKFRLPVDVVEGQFGLVHHDPVLRSYRRRPSGKIHFVTALDELG